MPRIPELSNSPFNQPTPVQGVNIPEGMGKSWAALADVGQKIADVGIDLAKKRQEAQDMDFVYAQKREGTRKAAEFSLKAQMGLPKDEYGQTNYTGYTQQVSEYLDTVYQDSQSKAPTEEARRMYANSMGDDFTRAIIDAKATEAKGNLLSWTTRFDKEADKTGQALVSVPSYDFAMQSIEDTNKAVEAQTGEGRIFTPSQADEVKKNFSNKIAKSFFDGMRAKEKYTDAMAHLMGADETQRSALAVKFSKELHQIQIDTAVEEGMITKEHGDELKAQGAKMVMPDQAFIQSRTGQAYASASPIARYLKPHERVEYYEHFKEWAKHQARVDLTEFHAELKDEVHNILTRGTANPAIDQKLSDFMKLKGGPVTPDFVLRTQDNRISAKAAYETIEANALKPKSQWGDAAAFWRNQRQSITDQLAKENPGLKQLTFKEYNVVERDAYANHAMDALNAMDKQRQKDPVAFIAKRKDSFATSYRAALGSDPVSTQAYIKKSLAEQRAMGIEKPRILALGDAAQLGMALKSGNDRQKVAFLSDLRLRYGDSTSKVLSEISGKDAPDYMLVGYATNRPDQEALMYSIHNKKALNDAFSAMPKETKDAVKTRVSEEMSEYRSTLGLADNSGANVKLANTFDDLVTANAVRIMQTSSGKSPEDAVTEAAGIVKNSYQVISEGRSKVLAPRQDGSLIISDKKVQAYMRVHLRPDMLEKKYLVTPRQPVGDARKPEEFRRMFLESLSKQGRWVPNDDMSGMKLVWDVPNSGGQVQEVINTNGGKVEVKFSDISRSPDSEVLKEFR